MLHTTHPTRRFLNTLAAIAVLLRLAIPVGYMPTALDDGWYLKLCPEGLSAQAMGALFGEDHEHHHGSHQTEQDAPFEQCDLGGGLTGELLANTAHNPLTAVETTSSSTLPDTWLRLIQRASSFQPRAPPAPV